MPLKSLRSLRFTAAAALALSFSCITAHATPVAPLVGLTVVEDGAQVSGALSYDTTSGMFGGSLTFHDGSTSYLFSGSDFMGGGGGSGSYFWTFVNSNGDALNLGYDISTVNVISADLTYMTLCSTAHPCQGDLAGGVWTANNGPILTFDTGRLKVSPYQAATTPEPSSIALLGTGVLGVAGSVRRRFRRA